MRIDLHTHSRISDGTETPAELVTSAAQAGLDVVALTDHDTLAGVAEATAAGEELGVQVVGGVEISTELEGRSIHLLGYGCDPDHTGLAAELERNREGRSQRIPLMCDRLTVLGVEVSVEDVLTAAGGATSVGRPHVADALAAKGYVADRKEAFDKYLAEGKPGYVSRYFTPIRRAISLIHAAGGAAVVAHPWGRGGSGTLTPDVIERLVRDDGLDGIEVWHADHAEPEREQLAALAQDLGVVATGSSDYHGTGKKLHPLGLNTTSPEEFAGLQRAMDHHRTLGR